MKHLLTDGVELDKLGPFQGSLISFLSFQKHNLKKREESGNVAATWINASLFASF